MGKEKTQFKKGNPGGPGRPAIPPEVKEARKLTQTALETILNKYLHLSLEELEKVSKDRSITVLEAMMLKIMITGMKSGDPKNSTFLFDRMIGKVKENVAVEGGIKIILEDYTKE